MSKCARLLKILFHYLCNIQQEQVSCLVSSNRHPTHLLFLSQHKLFRSGSSFFFYLLASLSRVSEFVNKTKKHLLVVIFLIIN